MFYQEKNVLVTGGIGFAGTHIVQELLKQGARIRVPIHRRPPTIQDGRIEFIQADLTEEIDCLAAVKGIDYVFHAAGAVGSANTAPVHLMGAITTDLVLGARMLHAAWAERIDRFLLVSSSTVYPPADYPVKEEEARSGEMYPSCTGYGWMK
jgi:GDP-L-fucose synthase